MILKRAVKADGNGADAQKHKVIEQPKQLHRAPVSPLLAITGHYQLARLLSHRSTDFAVGVGIATPDSPTVKIL
jgi:hypothetical protein